MKISSASKKVLASALSAAMVVAFAPTVAFGETLDTTAKSIVVEANGGTGTATATAKLVDGKVVVTIDGDTLTKADYNFAGWLLDNNTDDDDNALIAIESGVATTLTAGDNEKMKVFAQWAQVANKDAKVTVNFHAGQGVKQAGHSDILLQEVKVDGQGYIDLDTSASKIDTDAFKYNGSSITGWKVDTDGDGQLSAAEMLTDNVNLDHIFVEPGVSSIDLVAVYTSVEASGATLGFTTATAAVDASSDAAAAPEVTFGTNDGAAGQDGNLKTSTKYTVALSKGDTLLGQAVFTTGPSEKKKALTAADFPTIKQSAITEGTYTYTLYEGTKVVGSKDVKVCKLTLDNSAGYLAFAPGVDTTFYIEAGTNRSGNFDVPTLGTSTYNFVKYVAGTVATDANGDFDSTTIETDLTFVAVYDNPQVAAPTFNGTSISWTASGMATDDAKDLTVEVSGPVSRTYTVTNTEATKSGQITFSTYQDGQASTGNPQLFVKATPASGEYTIKVTQNFTEASGKASKVIGSNKVSLSAITYEVGEGVKATDETKAFETKDLIAIIQTNTELGADAANAINAAKPATKASSNNVFSKWTIDGKAVTAATKITGDTVVKANYILGKVSAPTYTVEANGKNFDIAFADATEGATIKYSTSGTEYTVLAGTKVTFDPTVQTTITVKAYKDGLAAGETTLKSYNGTAYTPAAFAADVATNILTATTSASTATKAQTYNDVASVKATVESGQAALKAIGYTTAKAWQDAYAKQVQASLDAVIAAETANLEAYKAGVANADGTVTKISEQVFSKAVADMKVASADYYAYNDSDTTTKVSVDSTVTNTVSAVKAIKAIVDTAKRTATTYAAADVTAAKAVSDAIAALPAADQATAADAEAAAKALEAYNALTAAQKQLVSSEDIAKLAAVQAATAEAKAAADLKDAQDDAAVSKAKGKSKTVKAGKNGKTTKKQTVTLKAITSKSGAKVTYAKKSGSKYITVSKAGKATLKKGVKAAAYKATVTAKCGTQKATVKVTFKVVK